MPVVVQSFLLDVNNAEELGRAFDRIGEPKKPGVSIEVPEPGQDDAVVRLHHVDFPGWTFAMTVDADGSLRDFAVSAAPEEPEITARKLSRVPVGALHTAARIAMLTRRLLVDARETREEVLEWHREQAEVWVAGFLEKPRPGRAGRPDIEYARIAALYVECLGGETPLRSLAELLASRRQHLSDSQIRNLLHEARRRGLLTGAPKGRAGGKLTEKARQLLEGEG